MIFLEGKVKETHRIFYYLQHPRDVTIYIIWKHFCGVGFSLYSMIDNFKLNSPDKSQMNKKKTEQIQNLQKKIHFFSLFKTKVYNILIIFQLGV